MVVFNHNNAQQTDVKSVAVHVSDDNAAWRLVMQQDLLDTAGASPNPPQTIHVLDAGRFWKLSITAVHDDSKAETGLAEVQLYQQGSSTDLSMFAKHAAHSLLPDVYSTLSNMGPLQCSGSCVAAKQCKSFTHHIVDNECALSTSNRNGGADLQADSDYNYYEKVVDTHSSGWCKPSMTDYRGMVSGAISAQKAKTSVSVLNLTLILVSVSGSPSFVLSVVSRQFQFCYHSLLTLSLLSVSGSLSITLALSMCSAGECHCLRQDLSVLVSPAATPSRLHATEISWPRPWRTQLLSQPRWQS